jgi:hypothetical protein
MLLVLSLATVAPAAQALSQCPVGATCTVSAELEVRIVAALDVVAAACSKLDPSAASSYKTLAEQFFADQIDVVREARKSKTYTEMARQSEAEVSAMSPNEAKTECARVLQDLSGPRK